VFASPIICGRHDELGPAAAELGGQRVHDGGRCRADVGVGNDERDDPRLSQDTVVCRQGDGGGELTALRAGIDQLPGGETVVEPARTADDGRAGREHGRSRGHPVCRHPAEQQRSHSRIVRTPA
jgi:hypothetical protein